MAPPVVVACWGAALQWRCLDALARYRGPVLVRVPAGSAFVRISAQDVGLDWRRRTLLASSVDLRGPDGSAIGCADRVRVEAGPDGLKPLRVTVSGLLGTVERLPDGRWRNQDLLPSGREEPSDLPVEVRIESAVVRVVDRARTAPLELAVVVRRGRLLASGDALWASGILDAPGLALRVDAAAPRSGVWTADLGVERLDLVRWMSWLREGPEREWLQPLEGWAAQSGGAAGTLRLRFDRRWDAEFEGRLDLRQATRRREVLAEQVSFRGRVGTAGMSGALNLAGRGWQARGTVEASWDPRPSVGWRGALRAESPSALPAAASRLVPPQMRWREASYEGLARWVQDRGLFLNGTMRSGSVAWDGWEASDVRAALLADPSVWRADRLAARASGGSIEGTVAWRSGDGALAGRFSGTAIRVDPLLRRWWRDPPLRAVARVEALLAGTVAAPIADVRVQAYAGARLGSRWMDLGMVDVVGSLRDGVLTVPRSSSAGALGLALASGQYRVADGRLNGTVFLSGLEGGSWLPGLSGYGFARLNLSGDAGNPRIEGRLEAFGLEYAGQSLPFLSADLRADPRLLVLERAEAYRGTARLVASGRLEWQTRQVQGSLEGTGVQLADLLGPNVSGEVERLSAVLEGTWDRPTLRLEASAPELVAAGVRVSGVQAVAAGDSESLTLRSLVGRVGEGSFTATAGYDLVSGIGQAEASLAGVPLAELSAWTGPDLAVGGTLDGTARVAFDGRGLVASEAEGALSGVTVNGTLAGSGEWSVRGAGPVLSGSLTIGRLEQFLEVSDLSVDLDRATVSARVQALGLPVEDLWAAGRRALAPRLPSEEWVARVNQLGGTLTVAATIDGPWSSPNVTVSPIQLDGLALGSERLGSVRVAGSLAEGRWEASEVRWTDGPGELLASGKLSEDGLLEAQGDLSNLDLSILKTLGLDVPAVQGKASLSFVARGPLDNPVVDGSAAVQDFLSEGKPLPLSVLLSSIRLDDGGLSFEGAVNYGNLSGPLLGALPLTWRGGWDSSRPLDVSLRIPERDVSEVLPFLPWLDARRTEGRVSGRLAVAGTWAEPELKGALRAELPSLAAAGAATPLRDASAELAVDGARAELRVSAEGGRLEAALGASFGSLRELLGLGGGAWRGWPVDGRLRADGFRFAESFGKGGRARGRLAAELRAEGTLGAPQLSGRVAAEELEVQMPSEFGAAAPATELPIDPRLSLSVSVGPGSRLRAPLAEVLGRGAGSVEGSLARLRAVGTFAVASGSLSLPSARVLLDPDGVARLSYTGGLAAESEARIDIDLNGRTSVTALGPAGVFERYQLLLSFRGDLLSPEGLAITGQSEPPDLSPERIRAIIGQEDLVRTLEAGDQRALAGYALPVLFDAVTQDFARSAGLDFLGLDVGMAGEASLTAVRTFGRGLSLTLRRQVNETSGQPAIFDLRLNYRPPRRVLPWPGFSVMVGADQDRPWKLGVEYRRRL
ncbi:MAG: translocation/assembly module TamB domain-containing protein [Fimbriimonadaceae bacterium]